MKNHIPGCILMAAIILCAQIDPRAQATEPVSASKAPEIPAHFQPEKLKSLPYFENTTVKAYRRIGSRSPKWDSNAETALLLFARQLADSESVLGSSNYVTMVNAFRNAMRAGCDDYSAPQKLDRWFR
jgi:hypothetical protein